MILGVNPATVLDNISQTIGNIASKDSSINLKSISATLLFAKQSLAKFGLNVFEKSGKVVVKVNDLLKAIRSGGQAAFDKLKVILSGSDKYAKLAAGFSKYSGKVDINHILEEHAFNVTTNTKSKFIQNADIQNIANQAMTKEPRIIKIGTSTDIYTGQKFPSVLIEVDMGYQIGWNYQKTVKRNSLRIIINENGDIVTIIPVI